MKRLKGWNPSARFLPEGITLAEVKADHRACQDALKPIQREALAVLLEDIIDYIETFYGLKEERRKTVTKEYAKALEQFPEDIAHRAVERVKESHKWNSLPKRADLYEAGRTEWLERRADASFLHRCVLLGKDREPKMSNDERAAMKERIRALRERIGV